MSYSAFSNREHSVETDKEHWAFNSPTYFFATIPPRTSKYALSCDDACLQAQIDVFGKDHVGTIAGSHAYTGNFAALVYAESLPERAPVLAYLNEILALYEAFEVETAELMGAALDATVYKDPKYDNPIWQANYKAVLPSIVTRLANADTVLGAKCVKTLKELVETPNLEERMDTYTNMDDYLIDRIEDIAWPSATACAQFGANIRLTDEEIAAHDNIFWPLWAHSAYNFDYFTLEKETATAQKRGGNAKIISSIPLLQRLYGHSLEQAKAWVRGKCLELEKEYLKRKEEFFNTTPREKCPEDLLKWFDAQEAIATGFALWNPSTFRQNPPHEEGVREFYKKRLAEGMTFPDSSIC